MKLWEVLKALEENPKRKFEYGNVDRFYTMGIHKVYGESYFQLTAVNEEGKNISDLASGQFDGNFTLDNDWQEIKQPVTWQEAIEAWATKGKDISCKIVKQEYYFKKFKEKYNTELQDHNGYGIAWEHITKGTWYIEN